MITSKKKIKNRNYALNTFGNQELATISIEDKTQIVILESLHESTIHWYHYILGDCDQERLVQSMRNYFHFPGLDAKVKRFVETCDDC